MSGNATRAPYFLSYAVLQNKNVGEFESRIKSTLAVECRNRELNLLGQGANGFLFVRSG